MNNEGDKGNILANLIFERYNIEISKMKKTKFGTADCYIVYSKNDRYFLKVYLDKYDKEQIEKEVTICQLLRKE